MTELVMNAQTSYANPFADNSVTAQFIGPTGQQLDIPGFYDGNGVWRVRFTPTQVGTWQYQTSSTNTTDKGLHGISGSLNVTSPSSTNPLYAHGGFLKVSANHRYLTYTDGTPFFWLGDVWWFAPSALLPIDGDEPAFKTLVDKRTAQLYSILQWAFLDEGWGHEWCCGDNSTQVLAQQNRANPTYWQLVDRYFSYAQDHGLMPVIGFAEGFPTDLTLDQWKFLWSYVMARYGATPVTFLVTMEYNVSYDRQRVSAALALGQHIKDSDPYQRAMSVHPWAIWVDGREAWSQPWYDFTIVQGGHWSPPQLAGASWYQSAYTAIPTRPMVDAEDAFEGILGYGGSPNQVIGPEQTRRAAYYSIQLGGFGFTYGAHGLWYPTQSDTDNRYWSDWGTSPPWWVAMDRPAGQQMQYLRALYESVNWWELEPLSNGVTRVDGIVDPDWYQPRAKAKLDDVYLIWFPYGVDGNASYTLQRQSAGQRTFTAQWFDPQTGTVTPAGPVSCTVAICGLPSRPNSDDWVLVLTGEQGLREDSGARSIPFLGKDRWYCATALGQPSTDQLSPSTFDFGDRKIRAHFGN